MALRKSDDAIQRGERGLDYWSVSCVLIVALTENNTVQKKDSAVEMQ